MHEWFELATSPSVVRRAATYAVVVGTILVTINHGDRILAGTVSGFRFLQMGLTVMVPYCVSTLSSVQALRQMRRTLAERERVRPECAGAR
jgi:hypothetical protein